MWLNIYLLKLIQNGAWSTTGILKSWILQEYCWKCMWGMCCYVLVVFFKAFSAFVCSNGKMGKNQHISSVAENLLFTIWLRMNFLILEDKAAWIGLILESTGDLWRSDKVRGLWTSGLFYKLVNHKQIMQRGKSKILMTVLHVNIQCGGIVMFMLWFHKLPTVKQTPFLKCFK